MIKKTILDPDWQKRYKDMIETPEQAVSHIRPGQRVFIGTGCAQPQELVRALSERSDKLADVEIIHLLTLGDAPYAHAELSEHFRVNSFFIADNVRDSIQKGLGDYTPIFLCDIPNLFSSGQLPLDAALIQVSPPSDRGLCSLGISVDIVKSAAENASMVIAQINPNMPRTHGNNHMHITDFDVLVPVDTRLLEFESIEPSKTIMKVARNVASLIDNNSTLEMGIGAIPRGVLQFVRDKKDLGVHTEMITDEIIDLVEAGIINGKFKTLDRNKIVASFCMGTKRLYDYIDDNPLFAFHPTEYVNDPFIIQQQQRMVAVNTALEVDLTGQVCADSIGSKFFSGIGGQVDFNRGAARSQGGKAIIALPSTAQKGEISRIVSQLSPGAGVVTTRGDVHYVVTEYGVAYLHGKSVQERALALISIAHPNYRDQLIREAIEAKYIRAGLGKLEGKMIVQSRDFRKSMLLADGSMVSIRPIHPTDESRLKDLFYALSRESKYFRYMQHLETLPQKQFQDFVFIDHRSEAALVGTVPEAHGEEIIAVGRYYLDPDTNRAEVAFVVRDQWQGRGVGGFLLKNLITVAKRNGIRGFTAEVLIENRGMQAVFQKSGLRLTSRIKADLISYTLDFH